MKRPLYSNKEKKALKRRFRPLTQDDLLEVAAECNVSYSTVRVVRNMHSISRKVINALIIQSIKYEKAKNRKQH